MRFDTAPHRHASGMSEEDALSVNQNYAHNVPSMTPVQAQIPVTEFVSALAPEEEEESSHIRHEKLNGADLLVFTTAGAEEEDGSDKMLPLSLKASSAADVEKTKVKQSTGEVQTRSNREIGYLRRKAVGKYAFERLIV